MFTSDWHLHSRYGLDDDRMAKLPEAEREQFRFPAAAAMLQTVGIRQDDFWCLPARQRTTHRTPGKP